MILFAFGVKFDRMLLNLTECRTGYSASMLFVTFVIRTLCDEYKSANKNAKCINVLDAIMSIKESWYLVRTSTISNCFGKCDFLQKTSGDTSDAVSRDDNPDKTAFSTHNIVLNRRIQIMN